MNKFFLCSALFYGASASRWLGPPDYTSSGQAHSGAELANQDRLDVQFTSTSDYYFGAGNGQHVDSSTFACPKCHMNGVFKVIYYDSENPHHDQFQCTTTQCETDSACTCRGYTPGDGVDARSIENQGEVFGLGGTTATTATTASGPCDNELADTRIYCDSDENPGGSIEGGWHQWPEKPNGAACAEHCDNTDGCIAWMLHKGNVDAGIGRKCALCSKVQTTNPSAGYTSGTCPTRIPNPECTAPFKISDDAKQAGGDAGCPDGYRALTFDECSQVQAYQDPGRALPPAENCNGGPGQASYCNDWPDGCFHTSNVGHFYYNSAHTTAGFTRQAGEVNGGWQACIPTSCAEAPTEAPQFCADGEQKMFGSTPYCERAGRCSAHAGKKIIMSTFVNGIVGKRQCFDACYLNGGGDCRAASWIKGTQECFHVWRSDMGDVFPSGNMLTNPILGAFTQTVTEGTVSGNIQAGQIDATEQMPDEEYCFTTDDE